MVHQGRQTMEGNQMKLNIGSSIPKGKYRHRPWVNIDYCKDFTSSRVIPASALDLPFKISSFDEIHTVHVLEHVARRDHKLFLTECYRVLDKGGVLIVEVPDFTKTCQKILGAYANREWEKLRCWTLSVYGKHRYEGDSHAWGFYPELLVNDFSSAGFDNIKILDDKAVSNHHTQEPVIVVSGEK